MGKLSVDYISDLHLGFYLPYDQELHFKREDIKALVEKEIVSKKKGDVLVIAGDLCEDVDAVVNFLEEASEHYNRVFYVAGNHEYYLLSGGMRERFDYNSLAKIDEIIDRVKENTRIVFLDRANPDNHGVYKFRGFTIAGDTLWYLPEGFNGIDFYKNSSNDSRLIRIPPFSPTEQIFKLHLDSMNWYDSLPNDCDLIITHVPPVHNPSSRFPMNSCYYCKVEELKTKAWIYGHDHVPAAFKKVDTMFYSNPWGYDSILFPLENIEIVK